MALGPLANMPDLFTKSVLQDPRGFKSIIHKPGYVPLAHSSGWRTSVLRPYTVTYFYNAILKRQSWGKSRQCEDEQEINSSEEMKVKVHRLAYMPPNHLSGWRTSTLPNCIVTYCWDFESNVKSQDDKDEDRENTGGIESVAESQENEEDETSSYSSTDLGHGLRGNRTTEEKATGDTGSEAESEDNREEDKRNHSDSTDRNKEMWGVESTEMRTTATPDSEPESHEPYRPKRIGPLEMLQINRGLLWLDPEMVDRAVKYLEMERPALDVSILFSILYANADFAQTGYLDLNSFSRLTLSKIHDL
jgi:hypothetical protein